MQVTLLLREHCNAAKPAILQQSTASEHVARIGTCILSNDRKRLCEMRCSWFW